ncbi:MAG: hypothetical protein ISR54_07340 [Chlorobium phaeobacteroides]|nr:hypothetical protein [Chlorobium phaeobacteroides]
MPDRVRHDALGGWMPDHPVKSMPLFHRAACPPPTPVIPVPFLPVIPVPDTGIHSPPAKLHGCRIESGMTLWEDGCRITS